MQFVLCRQVSKTRFFSIEYSSSFLIDRKYVRYDCVFRSLHSRCPLTAKSLRLLTIAVLVACGGPSAGISSLKLSTGPAYEQKKNFENDLYLI